MELPRGPEVAEGSTTVGGIVEPGKTMPERRLARIRNSPPINAPLRVAIISLMSGQTSRKRSPVGFFSVLGGVEAKAQYRNPNSNVPRIKP